jgi:glycerol-3-phosphate dehydrogenase
VRQRLTARYGAYAAEWSAGARDGDLHTIPGTQTLWLELAIAARLRPCSTWTTCCCAARGWAFCCRAAAWTICRASGACARRTWVGTSALGDEPERYRALIAAALPTAQARQHKNMNEIGL